MTTGEPWGFCARCLRHHPHSDLSTHDAQYREARRSVLLCGGCAGQNDLAHWLTVVVGRARYYAERSKTTLENALARRGPLKRAKRADAPA